MSLKQTFVDAALVLSFVTAAPVFAGGSYLPTASQVDIASYMGRWYEIAALPQIFERDCFAVEANYTLLSDGKVDVVNSCHKGAIDGPLETAHGIGEVVDPRNPAKLRISFFQPVYGDYWILRLADDYSYALVGSPDRKSLWILSRTPTLAETQVQDLLAWAEEHDFPVVDVRFMPQATR